MEVVGFVGKEGLEPSRIAARDPKSRLSANSSTSPASQQGNYKRGDSGRQYVWIWTLEEGRV